MPVSSYEEILQYLFNQLPMFSRIGPAAYKKDLGNTLALCTYLGNPQSQFRTIHIAGTNGKGSVSHFLASIFQEAGYKTGLYTSPHIHDFRERIRVNGQMVEEEFVVNFVEGIKIFSEKIQPSFFELTVAMAFSYFEKSKVDIAIIETGLGGRLDSTNVITPELSVITNIGLDHVNMLGDTLGKIAYEKAGIIKPHTPVVIGQCLKETKPVFENKALKMQSEIAFAENKWKFISQHGNNFSFLAYETGKLKTIDSGLKGNYQKYNLPTVLSAVAEMKKLGWKINNNDVFAGIRNVVTNTGITGRWQSIMESPDVIVDVAHNEDGIRQVLLQLQTEYPKAHWHFILGFVNDKPLEKVLSLFPKNQSYYFTRAHIARGMDTHELAQQAANFGLGGNEFENVNDALTEAKQLAGKEDAILICGSFFIIAELKPLSQ